MAHVMNLFCEENFTEDLIVTPQKPCVMKRLFVKAHSDKTLMKDKRIIENILLNEKPSVIEDYFQAVQTSILPHMRKIVTNWMLEVCDDQQCPPEVYFHAINYLDRFLSSVNIQKSQFQLIASVCILLASKMTEVSPIRISQLVIYSDHSVTEQQLMEGEVMVLTTINWELSTITPITVYKAIQHSLSIEQDSLVNTLLTHCSPNYQCSSLLPSLTAAAAVVAAQQLARDCTREMLEESVNSVSNITGHSEAEILHLASYIIKLAGVEENAIALSDKKESLDRPTTPDDVLNVSQEELEEMIE